VNVDPYRFMVAALCANEALKVLDQRRLQEKIGTDTCCDADPKHVREDKRKRRRLRRRGVLPRACLAREVVCSSFF
jgi:hypothetical protein